MNFVPLCGRFPTGVLERLVKSGAHSAQYHLAQQALLRNARAAADRFSDIAAGREAQAATIGRTLLSEEKTG